MNKKSFAKYLYQLLSGLFIGALGGMVGLATGAMIGGNLGFPSFGGAAAGYEAAGVFFMIIGFCLGSLSGLILFRKAVKLSTNYIVAGIATLVVTLVGLFLYNYNASWIMIIIYVISTVIPLSCLELFA